MSLPKVIICDIDGTIALLGDRNRYDPSTGEDLLNYPIANILQVYSNQKEFPVELILVTGREEKFRELTEEWLSKHKISHYKAIYIYEEKW